MGTRIFLITDPPLRPSLAVKRSPELETVVAYAKISGSSIFSRRFSCRGSRKLYRVPHMRDNPTGTGTEATGKMSRKQKKSQALLEELIDFAQGHEIEVRTEKFLREVGYHVHSGSCRLRGKKLIILDRELSAKEQVDLLVAEIRRTLSDPNAFPPHLRSLL